MTEKIAELAASLDEKPPRTALGSLVLERYGNGSGFLATTEDVDLARKLFAHAAQAEIDAYIDGEQDYNVAI
jgi:hypothetical protein